MRVQFTHEAIFKNRTAFGTNGITVPDWPNLNQVKIQASNRVAYNYFGRSVAVSSDGQTAIIGALEADAGGTDAGAAYIFTRSGDTWAQQEQLLSNDIRREDAFGCSVALSGDGSVAIVGAYWEDDGGTNAGAAYIFIRDEDGTWTEQQKIVSSNIGANDRFGECVSMSDDGVTAIVGAPFEDAGGRDSGAAYIFTQVNEVWTQAPILKASDQVADALFGHSVAMSGDGRTAIVGAYLDNSNGSDAGTAYIFTQGEDDTWTEQQKIVSDDLANSDMFGRSVAISNDGDTAIVGAYGEEDGGYRSGAAYIFTRSGTVWTQQQKIVASDADASDYFGFAVAISGDGRSAIVGAHRAAGSGSESGVAYIYTLSGSTWTEQTIVLASDSQQGDYFGFAVTMSGDGRTAISGAHQEDKGGVHAGAAYILMA